MIFGAGLPFTGQSFSGAIWSILTETDLTHTEQRVATLLGRGWSNAQIAAELNWSTQTTRNYISRVYQKLGINRSELIAHFRYDLKQS